MLNLMEIHSFWVCTVHVWCSGPCFSESCSPRGSCCTSSSWHGCIRCSSGCSEAWTGRHWGCERTLRNWHRLGTCRRQSEGTRFGAGQCSSGPSLRTRISWRQWCRCWMSKRHRLAWTPATWQRRRTIPWQTARILSCWFTLEPPLRSASTLCCCFRPRCRRRCRRSLRSRWTCRRSPQITSQQGFRKRLWRSWVFVQASAEWLCREFRTGLFWRSGSRRRIGTSWWILWEQVLEEEEQVWWLATVLVYRLVLICRLLLLSLVSLTSLAFITSPIYSTSIVYLASIAFPVFPHSLYPPTSFWNSPPKIIFRASSIRWFSKERRPQTSCTALCRSLQLPNQSLRPNPKNITLLPARLGLIWHSATSPDIDSARARSCSWPRGRNWGIFRSSLWSWVRRRRAQSRSTSLSRGNQVFRRILCCTSWGARQEEGCWIFEICQTSLRTCCQSWTSDSSQTSCSFQKHYNRGRYES